MTELTEQNAERKPPVKINFRVCANNRTLRMGLLALCSRCYTFCSQENRNFVKFSVLVSFASTSGVFRFPATFGFLFQNLKCLFFGVCATWDRCPALYRERGKKKSQKDFTAAVPLSGQSNGVYLLT